MTSRKLVPKVASPNSFFGPRQWTFAVWPDHLNQKRPSTNEGKYAPKECIFRGGNTIKHPFTLAPIILNSFGFDSNPFFPKNDSFPTLFGSIVLVTLFPLVNNTASLQKEKWGATRKTSLFPLMKIFTFYHIQSLLLFLNMAVPFCSCSF